MLTAVANRRKRRLWSARTIALSVGVHLVALAVVLIAESGTDPPAAPPPVIPDTIWLALQETERPAEATTTPQPPVQAKGGFVALHAPQTVLDSLPPVDSSATPLTREDVTGLGRELQEVFLQRDSTPRQPATDPPLRDFRFDRLPEEHALEQPPELVSPVDALRILQRMYPPRLRDEGVTGRTTVVLVVGTTGAVEPGSVTVRETTHEGFRDAAIRAAEQFRFRPARLNGQPYAAVVALPIEWKILR